ncbi:recombinase family protein (plasmid) [Pontibacillus sp. ALD_SL1]|uniref:recombinase family protein n=1 Tax=Pontibacillus sp. ALD_SL1 TaxID=2777185 RepID=UPI001A974813|nr:recombinase family protein [Pontibacillus sp. ALD_SL1]QST02513.1 recombinase family protein [Pontibacillus sp. ALD_SL1]
MKCSLYIRVSSQQYQEEKKEAIETLSAYIQENGWSVAEVYTDEIKGRNIVRKEAETMIEDGDYGRYDAIVTYDLPQLARNGHISEEIERLITERGIHVLTVDGSYNTLENDPAHFALYRNLYEKEAKKRSEFIKSQIRKRTESGKFKGSIPPYGYQLKDGKLVPRKDETPGVVRRIYKEYLDGAGMDGIRARLNEEGVRSPSSIVGKKNATKEWKKTSLRKILSNPHYVGDLVQGRERTLEPYERKREKVPEDQQVLIPNTHEAIISRKDFEAVRAIRKDHQETHFLKTQQKRLFRGIMHCNECGSSMWYRENRKGYICGRHARYGNDYCTSHVVKEDYVKGQLTHELIQFQNILREPETTGGLAEELWEMGVAEPERVVSDMKERVEQWSLSGYAIGDETLRAFVKEIIVTEDGEPHVTYKSPLHEMEERLE